MSFGPFGKRAEVLPVEQGGTGEVTEAGARDALDAPSLTGNNTFSGTNTFSALTCYINGTLHVGNLLPVTSLRLPSGSILTDAVTETRTYTFPDATGDVLLDAPSDGSYYVRKDGAWVAIVP